MRQGSPSEPNATTTVPGRAPQARGNDARTTVLFVGGYPRSGSTLLDCMLGQVPGFFSTGELEFIWDRGMRRNESCGCGAAFHDCAFWTQVRREAFGRNGAVDAEMASALHRSVERIRNVPGLGARALRSKDLAKRLDAYAAVLDPLYAAVRSVSGCDVIVDSSKDPVHGFALGALKGVDLHVVHLVRDSRAVAFSHQRRKSRAPGPGGAQLRRLDPGKAALGWNLANALMHLLRSQASSFVRTRYEDLISAPRSVIGSVAESTGHPAANLDFITNEGVHMASTHTISGNPSRFQRGLVELRLDSEWQMHMRNRDRDAVTALTWPLLVRYGFLGRRRERE